MSNRIVTLVDMDCFYCQVEARLNPSLQGKPMAVVQYNKWKGGGIIAVNYEAREHGVTRSMRGDEARKKCPDIELVHVPAVREKADLTKYREAGSEVIDVLCRFSDCVERASIDEAYLDITSTVEQRMSTMPPVQPSQLPTTFVVGFGDVAGNDENERVEGVAAWLNGIYELQDLLQMRLAVAAVVVEEMRAAVFQQTGFRCSAGLAHNKILGKLACGLHKPNRQTVLPQPGVVQLFRTLPVRKVRKLGGKFGCMVEEQLGCSVVADLLQFSEQQLQQRFDEKTGSWLYNIARGIDHDPVTPRLVSKSIGCCKKFPGRQALASRSDVEFWLGQLATEVAERLAKDLEENKRRARLLTVSYLQESSCSRSGPLNSYEVQRIAADAFELIKKSNSGKQDVWFPPLRFLGLSVGKFVDARVNQNSSILNFFKTSEVPQKPDRENVAVAEKPQTSFFLRYLQQKAAGKPVEATVTPSSEEDMFQEDEKPKVSNQSAALQTSSVLGPSTSRTDNDDDKLYVSLSEIFPNLNEVDNQVVELLPLPLQEKLKARMHCRDNKEKHSASESSSSSCEVEENRGDCITREGSSNARSSINVSVAECNSRSSCKGDSKSKLKGKVIQVTQVENLNASSSVKLSAPESNSKRGRKRNVKEKTDCTDPEECITQANCRDDASVEVSELCPKVGKGETRANEETDCEGSDDWIGYNSGNGRRDVNGDSSGVSERKEGARVEDLDAITVCEEAACEPVRDSDVLVEMCPDCSRVIPLAEYLEHLDFHAAKLLHEELNRRPQPAVTHKTPVVEVPAKRKRGRPSKKPEVVSSDKKMRSITAFFTPK